MSFLKLIWDFRGPDALKTATHHEHHLIEYIAVKQLPVKQNGVEPLSDFHAIAFVVVTKEVMPQIRDDLRPHRGQVFTEE